MSNLVSSAAVLKPVKMEHIVMDSVDGDGDVLCDTLTDSGETHPSYMQQIFRGADNESGTIDREYMRLLDSFREVSKRDNPLRSIRYGVDNGDYNKREYKAAVTNKLSREDRNTSRVSKKNVESKPHVQASEEKKMKAVGFALRRRESLVTKKSVEAMHIAGHVRRNSQHSDGHTSRKENLEDDMVCDENYQSYLTWLVDNSKESRTHPETEIQVKCEEDCTMSVSDSDSNIIVVEDHPFMDEEDSPFVTSKSYKLNDLVDGESDNQRSSWFRKEIVNILKQPYTETELKELHTEASVRKWLIKCRQLQDGREISYETKQKRPSYLDGYPAFKRTYIESLHEKDVHKALNLLRGFIFYLKNVVHDDAFKPWLDHECLNITCS